MSPHFLQNDLNIRNSCNEFVDRFPLSWWLFVCNYKGKFFSNQLMWTDGYFHNYGPERRAWRDETVDAATVKINPIKEIHFHYIDCICHTVGIIFRCRYEIIEFNLLKNLLVFKFN